MKRIFIGLLIILFCINGNAFAGENPTTSANYILDNDGLEELPREPDFSFEILSKKDYIKMEKILFKYYNTYNVKSFNENNTGEIEEKIKKIEEILNTSRFSSDWNFLLGISNQEANHDLLKSLGYELDSMGIFPGGAGGVITWFGKNQKDKIDFYQIVKVTGYFEKDTVGLPAIITSDQESDFIITRKGDLSKDMEFDIQNFIHENYIEESSSLEIGYYIKEGDKFIKMPTYANNVITTDSNYTFKKRDVVGIGVINLTSGLRPYIVKVLTGSPAMQAGIREGDLVIKVNGEEVFNDYNKDSFIEGRVGDSVTVTVLRGGKELTFHMNLRHIVVPDPIPDHLTSVYETDFVFVRGSTYVNEYEISNYNKNFSYVALLNINDRKWENLVDGDGYINEGVIEVKVTSRNFIVAAKDISDYYEGERNSFSGKLFIKIGDKYYYRSGSSSFFTDDNNIDGYFDLRQGYKTQEVMNSVSKYYSSSNLISEKIFPILLAYKQNIGEEAFIKKMDELEKILNKKIYSIVDEIQSEEDIKQQSVLLQKLDNIKYTIKNVEMGDELYP